MKQHKRGVFLVILLLAGSLAFAAGGQGETAQAETVAVDFWTHWCSNNEYFEPFWVDAAQQFNAVHPEVKFSINLNCVPYEGYEAKYSSAFDVEKGPGIFNGMTHVWAGQFGVADPMPKDIADKMDEVLIGSAAHFGMYDGVRYGLPLDADTVTRNPRAGHIKSDLDDSQVAKYHIAGTGYRNSYRPSLVDRGCPVYPARTFGQHQPVKPAIQ